MSFYLRDALADSVCVWIIREKVASLALSEEIAGERSTIVRVEVDFSHEGNKVV